MTNIDRVKRVTDLFVEGAEALLGQDDAGEPVLIWVNKLNPFQEEEARRDGQARRGQRMAELEKDDSPERQGVFAEIGMLDDPGLARRYVQLKTDEIMMEVYDDLFADEDLREVYERTRRLPGLLRDAGAAPDDPRFKQVEEDLSTWMKAQDAARKKAVREAEADALEQTREDLAKAYVAEWIQKSTMAEFVNERQITELWMAMRDCQGKAIETIGKFDHTGCDHSARLVEERADVTTLPSGVLAKVRDTYDSIIVNTGEAGFSDAPGSSSASSEPSDAEAEGSTASTQDETQLDAPAT